MESDSSTQEKPHKKDLRRMIAPFASVLLAAAQIAGCARSDASVLAPDATHTPQSVPSANTVEIHVQPSVEIMLRPTYDGERLTLPDPAQKEQVWYVHKRGGVIIEVLSPEEVIEQVNKDLHDEAIPQELARLNEKTLPEDIVSRQELAQDYHTYIYDVEGKVHLHLRKSILDESPLFQELYRNASRRLHVILIDDAYIDSASLPSELQTKWPQLVQRLESTKQQRISESKEFFLANRESFISNYQDQITGVVRGYEQGAITKAQRDHLISLITERYNLFLKDPSTLTDKDCLETASVAGMQVDLVRSSDEYEELWSPNAQKSIQAEESIPTDTFVLLAVKDNPFTEKGKLIDEVFRKYGADIDLTLGTNYPDMRHSHPRVEMADSSHTQSKDEEDIAPTSVIQRIYSDLSMDESPGLTLRHELAHWLYRKWRYNTEEQRRRVETLVDRRVRWEIGRATEQREMTGDDNLYTIVFETPNGVIITQAPQEEDDTARLALGRSSAPHEVKGGSREAFKTRAALRARRQDAKKAA